MPASLPRRDVFHAIADPTRRQLLRLLAEQELPVTDITGHFAMTRTAVSKHLQVLSQAGLVRKHRVGRETRYALRPDPLIELKQWLSYYERFWDNKMAALKYYVEAEEAGGGQFGVRRHGEPGKEANLQEKTRR